MLIFCNLAVHFEGCLAFMGDILCMTYLSSVIVPPGFLCVAELVERPYILQTVTHRQYKRALRQAS